MLFTTISSLAALALASQAIAEPMRQPYKLKLSKMPVNSLFGISRRQSGQGYAPEQQFCSAGNTCAEACGKGFEQCSSNDGVVHCFNKSGKQTCCPGLTGDSCDDGFFCSADEKGATWCCPDTMSLKQCADAYNLPGSLVSESTPTATTAKSVASSSATTTTNDTATEPTTTVKIVGTSTKVIVPETTPATQAVASTPSSTSTSSTITVIAATPTVESAASPSESSATSSAESSTSATPPANGIVQASSDDLHVPVTGMVLLAAVAFAALL